MNKPDWKDAPEWAQWLAQEKNGEWWWHSTRPSPNLDWHMWDSAAAYGYAGLSQVNTDWKTTLEQRPAVQP